MNLKNSFQRALSEFKSLEGQYSDRVKKGTKDFMDYHYSSYFSGLINGVKFVWDILDNHLTEKEFEERLHELRKTYTEERQN